MTPWRALWQFMFGRPGAGTPAVSPGPGSVALSDVGFGTSLSIASYGAELSDSLITGNVVLSEVPL